MLVREWHTDKNNKNICLYFVRSILERELNIYASNTWIEEGQSGGILVISIFAQQELKAIL